MVTVIRWWVPMFIACGLLTLRSDADCHGRPISITKSIFYKKIKTLHLDFTPRTAINADGAQTPLATMVRVYQLRISQSR